MPKRTRWRLRYYWQFVPFTFNTVLFALAAWLAWFWLYKSGKPKPGDEVVSNYRPFILLMGKLIVWFLAIGIGISILSALLTWAYFLYLRSKGNTGLQLAFDTEAKGNRKPRLFMNARIEGAIRPLLGFVKGRLFYDDYHLTDKFPLISNHRESSSLWRKAIRGRSRLALPDIKEYQLRGGFIYFEDMLHLFSFAAAQPLGGQFYQPPVLNKKDDKEAAPKKTETLDVRIDQMRRVEGEPLNYKDFESGDDVRRIVWQVYARNRELVVRIPERFEPYASHLYFYASFYATLGNSLDNGFMKEMLNYYKNAVWTVYDTLAEKQWELRYVPDQSFNIPESLSTAERAMRTISSSEWQAGTPLAEYFSPKNGTVLCVSSLTDVQELRNIIEQADSGTIIYFVKVSRVFRHFAAFTLLRRIIFLPPKDRLNKLRSRWTFSTLRISTRRREKEIEAILQSSGINYSVV